MPWTPSDASHKSGFANTPKRQRMWAHVANQELADHGDDVRAIKAANAVVHRDYRGKPNGRAK